MKILFHIFKPGEKSQNEIAKLNTRAPNGSLCCKAKSWIQDFNLQSGLEPPFNDRKCKLI